MEAQRHWRLWLLTLLWAAASAVAPGPLCFERTKCLYTHYDAAGVAWSFDLSTLCKEGGTYTSGADAQVFSFNVCGNTSVPCSDYVDTGAAYESHGIATQLLQAQRGVNPNGCLRLDNSSCTDWTFGGTACCSHQRCEVISGPFYAFELVDPANPATGGVRITHAGWPDSLKNDNIQCPDQKPGLERLRQFVLTLECDPTGTIDDLTVKSYNENCEPPFSSPPPLPFRCSALWVS